jgi:hypothetical protein
MGKSTRDITTHSPHARCQRARPRLAGTGSHGARCRSR